MERYQVTEMKEQYLKEITAIYNHYVANSTATFHAQQLTCDEMRGLVFFANSRYKTFVLQENEKTCGYAFVAPHKARQAYDATAELTIYLDERRTGKGIGGMLLQHLEKYACKQGFHVLIGTICGENKASIRLVESNGYQKCAHYKEVGLKFGKWLDVVAYQKILH